MRNLTDEQAREIAADIVQDMLSDDHGLGEIVEYVEEFLDDDGNEEVGTPADYREVEEQIRAFTTQLVNIFNETVR